MKLIKKNTESIILDLQYSGHKSCLDTKMEIGKILIQIILDLLDLTFIQVVSSLFFRKCLNLVFTLQTLAVTLNLVKCI